MNVSIGEIRQDLPQLALRIHGKNLVYLDNAATTPKPQQVIDSQVDYYTNWNANVHRSSSWLGGKATNLYEEARTKIQHFINAQFSDEVIFTSGCTESINIVAHGLNIFESGGGVLVTEMEHHSNLLPWRRLAREKSVKIDSIPVSLDGQLDLSDLDKFLENTKLLAITHVSNVLGTINPIKEIIKRAHAKDVVVVVDGTQAVGHFRVDMQDLDADFYCFSGHKMYGPTGVGVLYGKKHLLERLDCFKLGGGMVKSVSFDSFVLEELPYRLEAGTPNIAGVIGLGAAVDWLTKWLSHEDIIQNQEKIISTLSNHNQNHHSSYEFDQIPTLSLSYPNISPFDLAQYLDLQGICVRSGNHCAQPLLQKLGYTHGTLRLSAGIFNTVEEVEFALEWVEKGVRLLG